MIHMPVDDTKPTAIYHRSSGFDIICVEVLYCELLVQLCCIASYGFEINLISNSNAQRSNVWAGCKHVENLRSVKSYRMLLCRSAPVWGVCFSQKMGSAALRWT